MKTMFLLTFAIILASCRQNTSEKSKSQEKSPDSKIQGYAPVSRIDAKNVEFEYSIHDTVIGKKERSYIHCRLMNKGSDTVYYISSSCSGLEWELIGDHSSLETLSTLNCNISWRIIGRLSPGKEILRVVKLRDLEEAKKNTKIGLNLRTVDHWIPEKILKGHQSLIYDVANAKTDTTRVVWGKMNPEVKAEFSDGVFMW